MKRTLIFTATYNEADNIEALIRDIFTQVPESEVLVVDDSSPDGTGEILDRLSKENSRVKAHHRAGKQGLGSAHLFAFHYAIDQGYDVLVTMDADFSHNPKYIPEMLQKLERADFVIGSRYAPGGKLDYGFLRTALSKTANSLARFLLKIPLHECTTSLRAFRISLLKEIPLHEIRSDGYSFFVEALFLINQKTANLEEVPIHFEDRRAGQSKISHQEIVKAVKTLFRLAWTRGSSQG